MNLKTVVYSDIGAKKKEILLPEAFNTKINNNLLRDVIVGVRNNNHRPTASTKTRGDVRGGGKKPWKQKGTGRARQGSTRAPHWIGGGITFGPQTLKNYSSKLTQVSRKKALIMLFKVAFEANKLIVVDKIPPYLKTKESQVWIASLPIESGNISLLDTTSASYSRGYNNLNYLKFQSLQSPRIDLLSSSDWIIITEKALNSFIIQNKKASVNSNKSNLIASENKQADS